jgi:formate dehydrogenase alpha subunit
MTLGSGAMTNTISDVAQAACILAIGTNTTVAHPVIAVEINKARRNGAKLIVANPREITLCQHADIWLRLKPGTDVALLMGMMRVIVDEGLHDLMFIEERCENFAEFKASLEDYDLNFVEQITGVPKKQIIAAATMYATHSPASILYAMGITQHTHGTDNVIATANLAMLTGNIGKPGSGINPLRGQNNVQGACDMGALPNVFTGYQPVNNPDIRKKFEDAWGYPLNPNPGMTLTEMIDAAHQKKLKSAFLVVGENPLLSDPGIQHTIAAFSNLEFLVVQDIFLSETARMANVVLPVEKSNRARGQFPAGLGDSLPARAADGSQRV